MKYDFGKENILPLILRMKPDGVIKGELFELMLEFVDTTSSNGNKYMIEDFKLLMKMRKLTTCAIYLVLRVVVKNFPELLQEER